MIGINRHLSLSPMVQGRPLADAFMRHLVDIVFNQNPLVLEKTTSVKKACDYMEKRQVGSVLVVDSRGRLVGIFTGRDARRLLSRQGDPSGICLENAMTADPVTLPADSDAIDALRVMWDGGFRHVPVIDHGKVIGVAARGDFKGSEKRRLDDEREFWEHMR